MKSTIALCVLALSMPLQSASALIIDKQSGALRISAYFIGGSVPNPRSLPGYMEIENSGYTDDVLLGASADFAGKVEVHEMKMDGDIMRMRPLNEGLALPAGETVELAKGGYHLMFMDLKQVPKPGETFDVTLEFKNAAEVTLPMDAFSFKQTRDWFKAVDKGHGSGTK